MIASFQVASGMRGYFAILYDLETNECVQTGIGSYATKREALEEAADWAECENFITQAEKLREEAEKCNE